jgi:hypothetical protein
MLHEVAMTFLELKIVLSRTGLARDSGKVTLKTKELGKHAVK